MKKSKGRSLLFTFLSVVVLALWVLFPAVAHAGQEPMKAPLGTFAKPGDFVPNQIVVFANTENAKRDILNLARAVGAELRHENPQFNMYLFVFVDDRDAEAALKKINNYKGLYSASRNWKFSIPPTPQPVKGAKSDAVEPQHITNDPGLSAQWWLWKIKEPYAGAPLTTDKGIAIIDTGVDYTHSDLWGKVVSVFDYVNWDSDAMDENGHGTHCAGIAAAKAGNFMGIHGVSPSSIIYAYRVLDKGGSGGWYQIQAAITDAANNPGVSVLSLSLGGYMQYESPSYNSFRNAVQYARYTKGKIVCVAAGNEHNHYHYFYDWKYKQPYYRLVPGYFPESFTVGASTRADGRAEFSNYDVSNLKSGDGTWTYNLSFVDIVAPGFEILSTTPGETFSNFSGTSMATSMVAGACARVWGKNPAWTGPSVMNYLVSKGRYVSGAYGWPTGERRLDLMKALDVNVTGLQGFVNDAEAGYPLYGVTVQAKTYPAGALVATTTTNKAGMFTLTGLTGGVAYSLTFSKTGYNTIGLQSYTPTANYINDIERPFYLVPTRSVTATEQWWRIVAFWGDTQPGYNDSLDSSQASTWYPYKYYQSAGMEADAYLKDPAGSVYYYNYTGALGTSPYVMYTYDSWMGKPLECHVIQRLQTTGSYGKYRYMVSCLDAPPNYAWGAIKYAFTTPYYAQLPTIFIYKGNTLANTIYASSATQVGTGMWFWHVFDISLAGTVTVVNQITDTSPL